MLLVGDGLSIQAFDQIYALRLVPLQILICVNLRDLWIRAASFCIRRWRRCTLMK